MDYLLMQSGDIDTLSMLRPGIIPISAKNHTDHLMQKRVRQHSLLAHLQWQQRLVVS